MKTIRELSLALILIMFGTQAFSQSFILKGGANFANLEIKDNDRNFSEEFGYTYNPGFHIGGLIELPVTEGIFLETGLLVETKGFRFVLDLPSGNGKSVSSFNLYYVDVPIHIKYRSPGNAAVKFFVQAGPYVGVGIQGKLKNVLNIEGEKTKMTEDIVFGSNASEDEFQRLDYGLSVGTGVEFNKIVVGAGFDLGLANLVIEPQDGFSTRTRTFRISVGYKIGK